MMWRDNFLFEVCCDGGQDLPFIWQPVRGWVRDPWGITQDDPRKFTLHHTPTGALVQAGLRTLSEAQDLAEQLDGLAVDWNATTHEQIFDQLRRSNLLEQYHEIGPPMRAVS